MCSKNTTQYNALTNCNLRYGLKQTIIQSAEEERATLQIRAK